MSQSLNLLGTIGDILERKFGALHFFEGARPEAPLFKVHTYNLQFRDSVDSLEPWGSFCTENVDTYNIECSKEDVYFA